MSTNDFTAATLSRRRLITAGGSALLIPGALAACSAFSREPSNASDDASTPGGGAAKGREAPMLTERVSAGELPPVEERLPTEPLVVQPTREIGVYGGDWRTALLGPSDIAWLTRTVGYDNLLRWDVDWEEVIPNLAAAFEADAAGRTFTFTLRDGLCWSDGEPFTAADVVFAHQSVLMNAELTPVPPTLLMSGGQPGAVEQLDDLTVRFTFAEPHGMFLQRLATPSGHPLTAYPQHYFGPLHPDHNADVDELVREAGVDHWTALFWGRGGDLSGPYWQNSVPTMAAWVMTTPLGTGSQVVAERNPYYFKVDPEDSQLPYLDRVVFSVVQDEEVMLTRALNGDFDMHARHFTTLRNKPVLAENRERGDYDFFDAVSDEMNTLIVSFNLTHPDPVKRQVFQTRDFRIALSHAIDRQQIIDVVYQGQGRPWQAAPRPEDELHHERLATQYTEFDVDLANRLLDEAGFTRRGGTGPRLGPDGAPVTFALEYYTGQFPDWDDALELVAGHWAEIGIEARPTPQDRSLWSERVFANTVDATVFVGVGGLKTAVLFDPAYYLPSNGFAAFAFRWLEWNSTGGAAGEEPPEPTRRQLELYRQLQTTVGRDEQHAVMREILDIAAEEFYAIGVNLTPDGYGIVKNTFHNVPDSMFFGSQYPSPAATNPEQYFVR